MCNGFGTKQLVHFQSGAGMFYRTLISAHMSVGEIILGGPQIVIICTACNFTPKGSIDSLDGP